MSLTQAQKTVSGTITDSETGDPLIGANVMVKGTTMGTVTDFDGRFSLQANEGDVLVVSYTGYDSKELTVGMSNDYPLQLTSGESLEEVVVIGYGSVRKADLTGSVVAVGEDDFNRGVYTSPEQLIQGQAAGVQITNNSGQPGGLTTVRIRGNSSIRAGNQPLFVVDGVQLTGVSSKPGAETGDLGATPGVNPLNYINPNDIESMQILKDASATAIYGSRGANGVIIITTKKGRKGAPSLDVTTSVGSSSILNKYEVLTADEYRAALLEYDLTSGDFGSSVDAFDEITRTAFTHNHTLAINGGNEDGRYRISLGYLDQEGIIKENELRRLSANLSSGFQLLENKRLGIDFNILAAQTNENGPAISTNAGFRGSLIGNALQWNPTHAMYNEDGSVVVLPQFGNFTNPVALLEAYDDRSNTIDMIASVSPSYKLTDELTYRLTYSVTHGAGDRRFQVARWINLEGIENRGLGGYSEKKVTNQILTHQLNWIKDLSASVNLNAVLGFEYQQLNERGTTLWARDFILEDFDYTTILSASGSTSRNISNYKNPTSELQSYFLRTNWNIRDKYLLTATLRTDGSSKFGENNKYAFFPAFGAAWNLHQEDFLSGGAFDQLKFRVGWGKVGNSEFPAGASQERYLITQDFIKLENVANPDLKWETTTTFNVGFDFELMDQRLGGSLEYFHKNTEDLLFELTAIDPAPFTKLWVNLEGNLVNSGIEAALNLVAVDNDNLRWEIGGNVAFLDNILENYEGGPNILYGELFGQGSSGATIMRLENGQPLNAFYLRDWTGLDAEGQSTYANDEALYYAGDPNANMILGLNTNLTAGRLNINVNFNGAFGYQIYNNTKMSVIPIGNFGSRNIDANLLDGEVLEATSNALKSSDRYLEDGDYLKLTNATLTYDIGKIGRTVSNARIYVSGQNLLVFTNYTGFDPEVNTVNIKEGLPSAGIEYIPYPSARTFTLGVNFSL